MSSQPKTSRADRIEATLRAAFAPVLLVVEDESARHAGHAGATAAGQTHYAVRLVSPMFAGKGRVERSRLVHAALSDEFANGLHALALQLQAPNRNLMPNYASSTDISFNLTQSCARCVNSNRGAIS